VNGENVLADHLGTGDYAITRTVFAALVLLVVGTTAAALLRSGWTRAIGLLVAAVFVFAAVRVHFRWEEVTNAADLMLGGRPRPGAALTGGGFQISELDEFGRTVFGGGVVIAVLWLLVVALMGSVIMDRARLHSKSSNERELSRT